MTLPRATSAYETAAEHFNRVVQVAESGDPGGLVALRRLREVVRNPVFARACDDAIAKLDPEGVSADAR